MRKFIAIALFLLTAVSAQAQNTQVPFTPITGFVKYGDMRPTASTLPVPMSFRWIDPAGGVHEDLVYCGSNIQFDINCAFNMLDSKGPGYCFRITIEKKADGKYYVVGVSQVIGLPEPLKGPGDYPVGQQ